MAKFTFLLSSLLLAIVVSASPIVIPDEQKVTLPFALKLGNLNTTIADLDRARAAHLQSRSQNSKTKRSSVSSISVVNTAVTYTTNVAIGNPPTTYDLLIDTGSSNTWVGAGTAYGNTGTNTGVEVQVSYGSGSFSGTEWIDTVSLSSSLVISKQSIGVASTSSGFEGVDGIIGIGPTILTEGTLVSQPDATIPTVTNNLFTEGTIPSQVVGISYNPLTTEYVTNGELTFGGTDSSKFTGSITYTPITTTEPASYYWGINESITYGSTTILSTTAGIVDTGTTLVLLASNAFSAYQKATGATLDETTGLLKISSSSYNKLQNLNFLIAGETFTLTPNAQIWPRSLNSAIGGSSGDIYLIVASIGTPSGQGLDFINGYTFLERFYSVFDTTNSRVGFALTANTDATTN